jgi:MFS family permease
MTEDSKVVCPKDDKLSTSNPSELELKQKTMKTSIQEGSCAGLSLVFGDNYIAPYAMALNASDSQVGLLSAFVGLISPVGQIIGSRLIEKHSRRSIASRAAASQALMWIPMLSLGLIYAATGPENIFPLILIGLFVLYIISGNITGPAWFSLMGDIVPEEQRGRYFAKRNVIYNSIALSATLGVSFMLDSFKSESENMVFTGFAIIFFIAFVMRMLSSYFLSKHYEPKLKLEKGYFVPLHQFLKTLPATNFGKFVIFVALINFGQMIAGPFFSVYMIQVLNFEYWVFTTVNLSATFVGLLLFPLLGRIGDKYGNIHLLRIGAIIVPFLPLFWLFLTDPLSLILLPQLLGSIGWNAFNLAASNFIYDSIDSQHRALYAAYYNFTVGMGIFFGGLIGSIIIGIIPITFMSKFHFVFLLSSIVRIGVLLILLPKIKEIRHQFDKKPHQKKRVFIMRPTHLRPTNTNKFVMEIMEVSNGASNGEKPNEGMDQKSADQKQ